MESRAKLLVTAGDIGGARALIPVLVKICEKGQEILIHDNGPLMGLAIDEGIIFESIKINVMATEVHIDPRVSQVLFATSVKDIGSLSIARAAKRIGLRTSCLLDNWMNCRRRLELDGQQLFIPDDFILMDEFAKTLAIQEGIPEEIIRVLGQPALATVKEHADAHRLDQNWVLKLNVPERLKIVIFVSEPVEQDQGADSKVSTFRGYTEKTVLQRFVKELSHCSDEVYLAILPHPREDRIQLDHFMRDLKSSIKWGIIHDSEKKKDFIYAASGVAGMASILLYESWLINKNVISIQPNLMSETYDLYHSRADVICIEKEQEWTQAMDVFINRCRHFTQQVLKCRPEALLHEQAPLRIAELLLTPNAVK